MNRYNESLLDAALYGNYTHVEFLVYVKSTDVNFQSKYSGNTALILASYTGHFNIVKLLVKRGANVNAIKCTGETALIVASNTEKYKSMS